MSPGGRILVSVVVPTYRRIDLLERCLWALFRQDFDPSLYEIVVADDGDDPRVRELVVGWRRSPGVPRLVYVPVRQTQGPAGARNAGWRHALGEVIAFTDDDTIAAVSWLSQGWQAMVSGVAAAAGKVRVPISGSTPTDYERDIGRMSEAEFVTANCFVRRDALRAIGGFDERFTAAWREDSDLQFRLLASNGQVVRAPTAVVDHPVRPMTWGDRIRAHRKMAFDALLYKKHPVLYRERIGRSPPWNYYAIVASIGVAITGLLAMVPWLCFAGLTAWFLLTSLFCLKRLRGTSHEPRHILEMIVTSMAIPVVAVFWRLAGAWRYRVRFM